MSIPRSAFIPGESHITIGTFSWVSGAIACGTPCRCRLRSPRDSPSIADGAVTVVLEGDDVDTTLPISDAPLIVHGILRRLPPPGVPGVLTVATSDQKITLTFNAQDIPQPPSRRPPARASDRRLGLTLAGRLAERIGWEIDDAQAAYSRVQIRFGAP